MNMETTSAIMLKAGVYFRQHTFKGKGMELGGEGAASWGLFTAASTAKQLDINSKKHLFRDMPAVLFGYKKLWLQNKTLGVGEF